MFRPMRKRKRIQRIVPKQQRITLPVEKARIGMHVIGLDRPWEQVPLLFQSFTIEQPEQIDILKKHCQWITIERTGYGEDLSPEGPGGRATFAKDFEGRRPLAEEIPNATQRYQKAQTFIDTLLRDVTEGREPSIRDARAVVRECIVSIANNPNAMFWLSRIRSQDAYTAEHCVRVGLLAITFGRFIGLPEKDLEILGLSGMLHDVGKMKVPTEILFKPGALTTEEWLTMRQHPVFGHELLGSEHELEAEVRDAALSHHERLDGKGYPHSLSEPEISKTTRIITIVDAYDAITSDRPYTKGIPSSEALRILYKHRSTQFDDLLVECFIQMIGLYPPGSLVELNTGEIAVVLAASPQQKLRPIVEVVLDQEGNFCQPRALNLSQQCTTANGECYSIARALPDGYSGFSLSDHITRLSNDLSFTPTLR